MADSYPTSSSGLCDLHHVTWLLDQIEETGIAQATMTSDGKQMVTASRLIEEVKKAVRNAGGRASSSQLVVAIGVDETAIRATMCRVSREDSETRCVEQGGMFEILTHTYLGSLAQEAGRIAAERGRVALTDLSTNFKLPIDFTEEFISARVHDPVRLVRGALMTHTYQETKKNELFAACCAATQPLSVEELMRQCDLQGEEEKMTIDLLTDLSQSGQLEGSLTGGRRREYVPGAFLAAQHKAAYCFFSANGYLDLVTAQGMQVHKLHAFVKEKFPNAEYMETVVVSRAIVEQLEAVADEAASQGAWFEAWSVVPVTLSDADATHLVGVCSACRRAADDPLKVLQLGGVYGVSKRFLEELVDLFRADSVVAAKSTAPGRARRGGDEHLPRGNTSARTGAGKGRRKKGGRKGESEVGQVSEEEVVSFITFRKPELQDHPRLVSALGAYLSVPFREAKTEATRRAQQCANVGIGRSHQAVEAFETEFEGKYLDFQLHCRGVSGLRRILKQCTASGRHLSDDDAPTEGIDTEETRAEVYLLRTRGAELAEMVTARECEKLGIAFASQDAAEGRGPERMPTITEEACAALVEVIPGDVGRALASLWRAIMFDSKVSVFCETLENKVLSACNLVGRRLDKRRERQLLAEEQRAMKESLFKSVTEQDVLHFATLLVFQSVTGVLPLLPRPAMPSPATAGRSEGGCEEDWSGLLLNAIRGEASSEAEQALTNLGRDIQASEDDSSIGVACGHETSVDDTVTSVREPSVVVGEGEGQKVERRDTAARLMRSMEAARALGLSCGE